MVLILLATRPSDRPEVKDTVAAARREGGSLIELGPLAESSLDRLAGQIVGRDPGEGLSAQLARASGNPLFVVELNTTLMENSLIKVPETGQAEVTEVAGETGRNVTILHASDHLKVGSRTGLRICPPFGPFSAHHFAMARPLRKKPLPKALEKPARPRCPRKRRAVRPKDQIVTALSG